MHRLIWSKIYNKFTDFLVVVFIALLILAFFALIFSIGVSFVVIVTYPHPAYNVDTTTFYLSLIDIVLLASAKFVHWYCKELRKLEQKLSSDKDVHKPHESNVKEIERKYLMTNIQAKQFLKLAPSVEDNKLNELAEYIKGDYLV